MTVVLAMILDALFGEPRAIWDRWPHPAILMGRLIGWGDRRFNEGGARRLKGTVFMLAIVASGVMASALIAALPVVGSLAEILIGAALLAHKSLIQHVIAVSNALRLGVPEGRKAVAMIVGRDTSQMTQAEVARGAIESAAENFSDGVIAPLFWFVLLGLPGLVAYKLVNTADSMIGYRTPRHEAFGWAAARLDDLVNLIPARLSALLIALASGRMDAFGVAIADAKSHRSPNAGWPEGAMAGALGIALSGPRSYHGQKQDLPWVHAKGRKDAHPADIDRACRLLWRAWGLSFASVLLIVIL